ncbi:ATP-binding protein [Sphingomonas immobilis]|uniref:histidine kinase n=1 Tax=Sphingomonas immobilis TaxID=3063997 RepID=A0ABT8ZWB6_9SPHN|nr:ATP-binding protein [Sphingomonas sp. CA1-15]MDO7841310.1 CHASE3 domain-containing protein [Sphingomonas sp. CA1-15]
MTTPALHAIAPRRPSMPLYVLIAVAVPVVVAILFAWLGRENAETEALRMRARAAYDRRVEASSLITRIADAESSQRGYIITGEEKFLAGYAPARADVFATFGQLGGEVADVPDEAQLLGQMRDKTLKKFTEMDRIIEVRQDRGLDAAAAAMRSGSGFQLMDEIRGLSAQIVEKADADRDARAESYRNRVGEDQFGTWMGIAGGGILLLIAALMLWRQSNARYRARLAAYSIAERNRAILDSTIDAIAILNPSGTIETINAAAQKMLGYRPEELERRYVSTLIKLEDRPVTFHERIGLRNGALVDPYLSDRTVLHRDGHEIPVDIALGVMRLPDGDHIVASVRDISERKRVERAKDDLMSTVSHELRTPLTSVVGALGLLRNGAAGELPGAAARLIEIAENNSRRLIRLINDMLDIDRIQSGALHLAREPIDLREVLEKACEGSHGLAGAAGVRIDCAPPEAPVIVAGDADRLLQVVTNLASNAIRVSPPDGVVTIGLDTLSTNGRVIVTVDDDGPGVPAEFRRRIFGRFERASDDQSQGTGLGLAISREIVKRHDGTIWFEDRPGGGSRFAFVLDLVRAKEIEDDTDAPRVLICEDDALMAETLRKQVVAAGHRAHVVGTAAAARAALSGGIYSALLLDLRLPDESGFEIAKWVRASKGQATLPIIVVSAMRREDVPFDIIDWIEKPANPARLSKAVAAAVARSETALPTVIHLDDDPDMLDIVASVLGSEARVLRARNLTDARLILETGLPDVAILDLDLAQGSGTELLPELRDARGIAIPTIIFSAHDVRPEYAAQVDAVLVKSRGSLPDLKATVRRLLRHRVRP